MSVEELSFDFVQEIKIVCFCGYVTEKYFLIIVMMERLRVCARGFFAVQGILVKKKILDLEVLRICSGKFVLMK